MATADPDAERHARIAAWAGCAASDVADLEARGLVAPHLPERVAGVGVRLLLALEAAGLGRKVLGDAVRAGDLVPGFVEHVAATPVGLTGTTFGDRLGELGLALETGTRLFVAAGLPPVEPSRPLREDDARLLQMLQAALGLGISEATLASVLRVFAQSARRIGEAMREAFRSEVEDRLRAQGVPPGALPTLAGAHRPPLQRLGIETAGLLLARVLEDLVVENVTVQLETALAAAGRLPPRGRPSHAVAFVDLAGFTQLTQAEGDLRAAAAATRLEGLAHAIATARGSRLVKGLGDGVLLLAPTATALRRVLVDLSAAAAGAGLPSLRGGAAFGPVVFRDGDVFGGTVNRAARLVAAATPGVVLGDAALVEADQPDAGWAPRGSVEAKGLGPLPAWWLTLAS